MSQEGAPEGLATEKQRSLLQLDPPCRRNAGLKAQFHQVREIGKAYESLFVSET